MKPKIGERAPGRRRGLSRVALVALLVFAVAFPAQAFASDLPRPGFGPGIDPFATYDGQSTCDPTPKPGVVSFKRIVTRAFPTTGEGYISRSCGVGGQSEHKEGRAWDWPVSAYKKSDVRKVDKVLDWLLKRDSYSHKNARARRFGIMYIIWNRRIWFPWKGWEAYRGASPHTDHVHFSFTWHGARKRTTNWRRKRSFVSAAASNRAGQGYWSVTGTATVMATGGDFHGDHRKRFHKGIVEGIAALPSGKGYWLVKRSGRVLPFGDARALGRSRNGRVVDIAPMPYGQGYWTVTRAGKVRAFGNAQKHGDDTSNARIVGIAPTPSGAGYWLATRKGRVFSFGNARRLGHFPSEKARVVDIEPSPTQGYWLVTGRGRVAAFGGADFAGDTRAMDLAWPIAALTSTPSGNGYWLINRRGRARAFGTADALTSSSPTSARPEEPAESPIPERREGTGVLERYVPE